MLYIPLLQDKMDDEGLYAAGRLYELSTKHNSSNLEAPFFHKEIALRTVVGVTCSLSLIGALIIILSYCLDKEIRTKSRQILVHLSVAYFGVALANLIGVIVYFDQYIRGCTTDWDNLKLSKPALPANETYSSSSPVSCGVLFRLCEAQAFMAGYSTLASVMWTQILAVYVYCLVVLPQNWKWFKVFFMYFTYIFCWGLPFVISLWLVLTRKFYFEIIPTLGTDIIMGILLPYLLEYKSHPSISRTPKTYCIKFYFHNICIYIYKE